MPIFDRQPIFEFSLKHIYFSKIVQTNVFKSIMFSRQCEVRTHLAAIYAGTRYSKLTAARRSKLHAKSFSCCDLCCTSENFRGARLIMNCLISMVAFGTSPEQTFLSDGDCNFLYSAQHIANCWIKECVNKKNKEHFFVLIGTKFVNISMFAASVFNKERINGPIASLIWMLKKIMRWGPGNEEFLHALLSLSSKISFCFDSVSYIRSRFITLMPEITIFIRKVRYKDNRFCTKKFEF